MGKRQLVLLLEILVFFFALAMVITYAWIPVPLSLEELAGIDTILRSSGGQMEQCSLFQLQNPDAFWLLSQWISVCREHLLFVRVPGILACIVLFGVFSSVVGRLMPGWGGLCRFFLVASPLTVPFYVQLLPAAPIALFLFLAFCFEVDPSRMKNWINTILFSLSLMVAAFLSPLCWPVVLVLIGMRWRRLFLHKVYAQSIISCLPLLLIVWYWNLFATHWSVLSSKAMWGARLATPLRLVYDVGDLFLYGFHGVLPFGCGILLVIMLILCFFSASFIGWRGLVDDNGAHHTLQVVKKGLIVVILSFCLLWTVGRIGLASVYAPMEFCSLVAPIWILVVVAGGRMMFKRLSIRNRESMTILCLLVSMVIVVNCLVQRRLYAAYNEPARSLSELNTITSEFENELIVVPERLIPFVQGGFESPLRSVQELGDRPCTLLDVSAGFSRRPPQEVWLLTQFPKASDEGLHGITRLGWENAARFHVYDLSMDGAKHLAEYLANDPWPPIAPWDNSRVDSLAAPYDQLALHGWSVPEFDGWASCWTSNDEVAVLFDEPLNKGLYRLHVVGFRHEYPWAETTLKLELPGVLEMEKILQPGGIRFTETIEIPEDMAPPQLRITHPTWVPSLYLEDSQDHRRLGILFHGAWFEAVKR